MTATVSRRKFLARGAAVCVAPALASGRNEALAQSPQADPGECTSQSVEVQAWVRNSRKALQRLPAVFRRRRQCLGSLHAFPWPAGRFRGLVQGLGSENLNPATAIEPSI